MDLSIAVTLSFQRGFVIRTADLVQRLSQNLSGKPSATSQRFTERTVLLDHGVDISSEMLSGSLQRILELFTAHTGGDNRVPVHKADSACGQSLRKLIHRLADLSRCRTRHSAQVSDALNSCNRLVQIDTSRRESTDVLRHLGEVIDRLVGISIKLVQRRRDLRHRRTLACGVGKDRLNRVHLSLILTETVHDRSDREG